MINKEPLELIVSTVQEISIARDLNTLMFIVRKAAQKLTSAQGVTFVLKDKDLCFYADEEAIAPLWKGQRFAADKCISGWVMIHKEIAIINDIYQDNRVPHDAYRPTFVKSLAMVPIRSVDPIGAIGCYWSKEYTPDQNEIRFLQTLADVTAVSFEKLQLYNYLKEKVGPNIVDSHHTADILFSPQKFLSRIATL
ncbi:MAG: GAF domain-containing protein [Bacteroidota bacterium]